MQLEFSASFDANDTSLSQAALPTLPGIEEKQGKSALWQYRVPQSRSRIATFSFIFYAFGTPSAV
jgi:hypothetical protein